MEDHSHKIDCAFRAKIWITRNRLELRSSRAASDLIVTRRFSTRAPVHSTVKLNR